MRCRCFYAVTLVAAEAMGDSTAARACCARVIELSQHADSARPELQRARAYLERR